MMMMMMILLLSTFNVLINTTYIIFNCFNDIFWIPLPPKKKPIKSIVMIMVP
ncbi:hypothetical protein CLU79DRAFT_807359, partial [Phycomyces nitens]